MSLCTCGHPRERHLFTKGQCLHASKTEGGSPRYCQCKRYERKELTFKVKPQLDYDLGTSSEPETVS